MRWLCHIYNVRMQFQISHFLWFSTSHHKLTGTNGSKAKVNEYDWFSFTRVCSYKFYSAALQPKGLTRSF